MIREITIQDKDSFNYLGKQVNDNFENVYSLDEILNNNYSKVFVYEQNGKVIGFVHVDILYENIDLVNIVVDKRYRCQQVASKLLNYIIKKYLTEGRRIILEVNTKNEAALHLYKKYDFEIISTREKYYNQDDAYVMERRF